jgi:hypothetical protein
MAKITCFVCKQVMQNYTELAKHILNSKDAKHRTKGQIAWASRFINHLPAKDNYRISGGSTRKHTAQPVTEQEYWNSKCSMCHKSLKDCCC